MQQSISSQKALNVQMNTSSIVGPLLRTLLPESHAASKSGTLDVDRIVAHGSQTFQSHATFVVLERPSCCSIAREARIRFALSSWYLVNTPGVQISSSNTSFSHTALSMCAMPTSCDRGCCPHSGFFVQNEYGGFQARGHGIQMTSGYPTGRCSSCRTKSSRCDSIAAARH